MRQWLRVRIHPAGFALFAAAFLFADSHLALAALLALILHEGAHVLMLVLCGMHGCSVELTPFGGMMDVRRFEMCQPWKQILVSSAGVAASGCTAWICWHWFPGTMFVQCFFQANLSLAFLNILPLWPLDGARILTALAAYIGMANTMKRFFSFLSTVLGILLTLLGLYGVWHGVVNPTLLAAGPYLCYISRTERLTSRVRCLEHADQKLRDEQMLPASIWVGNEAYLHNHFASRLANGKENAYQVLLAVDPVSGRIQKWWTEREIMNHLLTQDRN